MLLGWPLLRPNRPTCAAGTAKNAVKIVTKSLAVRPALALHEILQVKVIVFGP
jgi:hypothetical protein